MRASAIAAAAAGDPYFANVVLLLDFAGSDGATTATDLSNTPHTLTFNNGAQIDTALPFIGENNLQVTGVNDYVAVTDDLTDFDFGTGDFTVELGIYYVDRSSSTSPISRYTSPGGWLIQYAHSGTELKFFDGDTALVTETWAPSNGVWYHIAVSRSGTDLRLFVDGTQLGTDTTDSTDFSGIGMPVLLGKLTPTLQPHNGYIGAVRVTKGVARYTANFTPPTEFYPTS